MNKLNLILLSFIITFSFAAQAQIGVKLGANAGKIGSYGNTEDGESADFKVGYQAGVFYKLPVVSKINLFVELNYEARGTVSKKDYTTKLPVIDPSNGNVLGIGDYHIVQEIKTSQSYLNIPVLVALGGDKLKVYAGPNFGFLISGKGDFSRSIDITLGGNPLPTINSSIDDVDFKDYDSFKNIFTTAPADDGDFLNAAEVGINVGVMYNLNEKLFLDLRANQGLTDNTNNSYDSSIYADPTTFTFQTREDTDRIFNLQLSVGYMF